MELILVSRAIYPLHGYGGMERHCHDWILAMAENGCKIHIITMTPQDAAGLAHFPPQAAFYFIPGAPARSILNRITSYPQWIGHVGGFLTKLLTQRNYDAIYAHGLAAAACPRSATPVYYNPHGMEEFKCTGLKYLAYSGFRDSSRDAAQSARRIIATDPSLIPEIVSFLRVPETKVSLIRNAVFSEDVVCTKTRADFGLDQDEVVLLAAGRLEPSKGFDVLIKALSIAGALPERIRLVIIGEGSQRNSLRDLAGVCKVESRVLFTGALPDKDMQSLYGAADLFVHPTLYEGSSLVTLEAMRAGLPVIASKTGGLPDKVQPGLNGWLVEPGNARALAATLEEACRHRERWRQMGVESARIVRDRYTWTTAATEFLKLFGA
jgi:glycosyltransferase involved in cell wall biosynthesis